MFGYRGDRAHEWLDLEKIKTTVRFFKLKIGESNFVSGKIRNPTLTGC